MLMPAIAFAALAAGLILGGIVTAIIFKHFDFDDTAH